MAGAFHLNIITPTQTVFEGEIRSVRVPGAKGSFQVLLNHAPIVSTLEAGNVFIELADGARKEFQVSGGVFQVLHNEATLLTDSIVE